MQRTFFLCTDNLRTRTKSVVRPSRITDRSQIEAALHAIARFAPIDPWRLRTTVHDFTGFGGLSFLCYQLLVHFVAGGGFQIRGGRHVWRKSISLHSRFRGSRLWQKSPAGGLSRNF
jgi:hypothetical protein